MDTQVDFPLEDLDMSNYIRSEEQKSAGPLIYDCYAVSNHMGGTGGGHYTAYAKSPIDGNWYCFDDSRVRPVGKGHVEDVVVSSSAYNLFYRRRDQDVDLMNVNFDALAQLPHTAFLEALDEKRKAKEAANKEKPAEENKEEKK